MVKVQVDCDWAVTMSAQIKGITKCNFYEDAAIQIKHFLFYEDRLYTDLLTEIP